MAHVASSRLLESIFRQILEELAQSSDEETESVIRYLYGDFGGHFSTLTFLEGIFTQLSELSRTTSDKVPNVSTV